MKKTIMLILFILLCSGCGKENIMICTFDNVNTIQGYKTNIIYNIHYKYNEVSKVEISETYRSNEMSTLNYFLQSQKIYYDELNDKYNGYKITDNMKDNVLTLNIMIDYTKVNLNKMIDDNLIESTYIKNGFLTKNGAKLYYEDMGAKCNE